jgi:hypothetical protein
MEEIHYLYKITNKVNGKLYIGVTKNPKHRQECHFGKVSQERLVNKAVSKYGKDNFSFDIICIGEKHYIYNLEIEAIKAYNSNATCGHGYNVCSGGFKGDSGNKGRKHNKKSNDTAYYVAGFWFPSRRIAVNSLGWGIGKFNGRCRSGKLGLEIDPPRKFGPQEFVFVTGFWFPSKKLAIEYTGMSGHSYDVRKKEKSLGSVYFKPPTISYKGVLSQPNYYRGFWFPDLKLASKIFDKTPESIRQQINRGVFEEDSRLIKQKPIKTYVIEGLEFISLEQASVSLNISQSTIKYRLRKNYPNYGFSYSTQGK